MHYHILGRFILINLILIYYFLELPSEKYHKIRNFMNLIIKIPQNKKFCEKQVISCL